MIGKPDLWYGGMYDEDKYARLRLKKYKELLSTYIKEGTKILDIGCYTADLFGMLPPYIDYLGIDFDKGALEIAQEKGAKVKEINFESEGINLGETFDIVIIGEVLEHLKNPQAILDNIKKLLKKDGILLASLPNECTLYHRLICLLGKGVDKCAFKPYKHIHFPTIAQSRSFVGKNFNIFKEVYFVMPTGRGSYCEGLGVCLDKIPYGFWMLMGNILPTLFARGVIFLAKNV